MQNSTCPTWRALERYRRDPAVRRHWVCTRLGIPDHHAGVQKSLLGFSNSPVRLHWFTASESIMSPVGVTRLLPQLQGSGMPAKQQLSHKWDFPFFFSNPTPAALTIHKIYDKVWGRCRKQGNQENKGARTQKRSGRAASNEEFQKWSTFTFSAKIARQKTAVVTVQGRTSAKTQK